MWRIGVGGVPFVHNEDLLHVPLHTRELPSTFPPRCYGPGTGDTEVWGQESTEESGDWTGDRRRTTSSFYNHQDKLGPELR